jgi:bifunctional non-homologous end joining protein LigD
MAKELNRVSLYCKEGGSDKQYTMWLEEKPDGFLVNFNYGPRGGWVKDGTKTPKPVSKIDAEKIYEKKLKEQKGKGYTIGEDAPAFSQVEDAKDSGLRPMLLTQDDEENLEKYITDDDWCAQQKFNGKHIMTKITTKGVIGSNKRGLECPIPESLIKALGKMKDKIDKGEAFSTDGELIGENYHIHDVPSDDRVYGMRLNVVGTIPHIVGDMHVHYVESHVGEKNKREFVRKLMKERKEGVVFKRLDGKYLPGRVNDLKKAIAVKIKFYKAISPVVMGWKKDKQSIEVGLREEIKGGKAEIVSVGWVTVPTKYVEQVEVGKPIRVRYLYATPAKQLYQAHLDPTDDGQVMADQVLADPITDLKFEGKEEE